MYINLSGLNILVTGASRGLGKAIATKLAEAGATIAVHYNKNMNDAESLAQVMGNESKAFQADLSDSGEAVKLIIWKKRGESLQYSAWFCANRYGQSFYVPIWRRACQGRHRFGAPY